MYKNYICKSPPCKIPHNIPPFPKSCQRIFLLCLSFFLFNYREYVREVKVRLVKYLTSCPLSPNHAKEFFTMLLDEYQALSKAFDTLRPFFNKLVSPFLSMFFFFFFYLFHFKIRLITSTIVLFVIRPEARNSFFLFSIDWKVWVQIMSVNKTGFQKQAMTAGHPPTTWVHDWPVTLVTAITSWQTSSLVLTLTIAETYFKILKSLTKYMHCMHHS